MNIVCIAGGSYKSFYINYYLKLKHCDLLVLNFGILYEYDMKEELLGLGIVTKEIRKLSQDLHCPVVAGIIVKRQKISYPALLVCESGKVYINSVRLGVKVEIKGRTFVVGVRSTNFGKYNKIILSKERIYPNVNNCSNKKIYIFCDSFGVDLVFEKKIVRKFHKYSKIILK